MRIYGEARTLKHLIFQQRARCISPFVHIIRVKKKKKREKNDLGLFLDQKVIKRYMVLTKISAFTVAIFIYIFTDRVNDSLSL